MIKFESYKNRNYILGEQCEVHYHFTKDTFSIKQNGVVVGYADNVVMKDCKTYCRKNGTQKVRDEKRKNVHAGVRGILVDMPEEVNVEGMNVLYYNPYKVSYFKNGFTEDCENVYEADNVIMTGRIGYWK